MELNQLYIPTRIFSVNERRAPTLLKKRMWREVGSSLRGRDWIACEAQYGAAFYHESPNQREFFFFEMSLCFVSVGNSAETGAKATRLFAAQANSSRLPFRRKNLLEYTCRTYRAP